MSHQPVTKRRSKLYTEFCNDKEAYLDHVKTLVKCILTSTKALSSVSELHRDYHDLENEWILYNSLGFSSLEELLESFCDIVMIDEFGKLRLLPDPEEKSKSGHIKRYVEHQNDTGKVPQPFITNRRPGSFNVPGAEPGTLQVSVPRRPTREEMTKSVPSDIQHEALVIVNQNNGISDYNFEMKINNYIKSNVGPGYNIQDLFVSLDNFINNGLSHLMHYYGGRLYPNTKEYGEDVQNLGLTPSTGCPVPLVKTRIKQNLIDLLIEEPQGIYCSEIPSFYIKTFRTQLPYQMFGYPSIHSFFAALPDLFRVVVYSDDREGRVYHKHFQFPPERKVSSKDRANIVQLLKLFEEEGIELDVFLCVYKVVFDRNFSYPMMFFNTLNEALLSLSEYGVYIATQDKQTRVFLDRKVNDLVPKAVPFKWDESKVTVRPRSAVTPRNFIPVLQLSDVLKGSQYVEIFPTDVYGPHYFHAVSNNSCLEAMSLDLMKFYSGPRGEEFRMPNSACQVGEFCCVKVEFYYCRGFIAYSELDSYFAVVVCIDFGSVEYVQKNYLYFLNDTFKSIPNLAFLCALNSIAPPPDVNQYSRECRDYFTEILSVCESSVMKVTESSQRTLELHGLLLLIMDSKRRSLAEHLLYKKKFAVPCFNRPSKELMNYAYWIVYLKKMEIEEVKFSIEETKW